MSESNTFESANDLKNRTNKSKAKFMNKPQLIRHKRDDSWSNKEKADFIDTLVRNRHCPPIYIRERVDNDLLTHNLLDGAHRIEAIVKFMNNKFQLETISTESPLKEHEGKFFRELPSKLRNKIRNYKFTVKYL